jgi:hypothetical protein
MKRWQTHFCQAVESVWMTPLLDVRFLIVIVVDCGRLVFHKRYHDIKTVGDSQVESTHPSSIRVFLQFTTLPAESSASCSENSKDIAASKQAGLLSFIIKDNQTDKLFCLCEEIQFYKSYIDQRA